MKDALIRQIPTQHEIEQWDHGQRARGHEMVRLLCGPEQRLLAKLQRLGYEVELYQHLPANGSPFMASAWVDGRCVARAIGRSELEALSGVCGELGVAV